MKTMTIKTFATGAIALGLLFTSCKKGEDGAMGPAGADGKDGVVTVSSEGFIKGNVSGTRQDGTAFNETFEYKNYFGEGSAILDSNSTTSYNFQIVRYQGDVLNQNRAIINVSTTSKTATTGNISLNDFVFSKSLGTNKRFEFNLTGSPSASITGLTYNTTSGMFKGNFSFTVNGFQNSTGNTATISGSFEATMTQLYNRMFNGNSVISTAKN